MEENKLIIARNITILRKKMKLSQLELAEKLNYSDKAVSKWERGESLPDIFIIKDLADLFGVTIDYLFNNHTNEENIDISINIKKHNQKIIALLSTGLVWFIATIIFVVWGIATWEFNKIWIVFIYSIPISSIVLLVFNSIWGVPKKNTYIVSLLLWSTLLTIVLTASLYSKNYTLIFFIGIPLQVIIILWSKLKIFGRKIKNNL